MTGVWLRSHVFRLTGNGLGGTAKLVWGPLTVLAGMHSVA
jgi:hypothetical protein